MTRAVAVIAVGTAFWLAQPNAHAASKVTGATLSRACKAAIQLEEHSGTHLPSNEQTGAQDCVAYLDGVFDNAEDAAQQAKVSHFCLPKGANRSVVLHVLVQYIDMNPRALGENGAVVVRDAMMHTYPCSGH